MAESPQPSQYCQTSIMDQNIQAHNQREKLYASRSLKNKNRNSNNNSNKHNTVSPGTTRTLQPPLVRSRSCNMKPDSIGEMTPLIVSTSSLRQNHSQSSLYDLSVCSNPKQKHTIRFQVVVWYIGQIDMVQGRVPMTFRVTIFWNDQSQEATDEAQNSNNYNNNNTSKDEDDDVSIASSKSTSVWQMHGRQRAFQKELSDSQQFRAEVLVPPVSILNVVSFDTIGSPEVLMLREHDKLMRWTCMYKATLLQEHWRVDNFPHDNHDISLKLAILAHRLPGQQWDRTVWDLGLATSDDSQGSTRIPHGLCVDHLKIPECMYDEGSGLLFDFVPLRHGPAGGGLNAGAGADGGSGTDVCLRVRLRVLRESGYYDNNIMPLLGLLNLVAISILTLQPADFFQRALLTLNIAFVEIGIRMTTDSRLPNVSYQIKMQRILNQYFWGLLLLVLEGCLVHEMDRAGSDKTVYVDATAAVIALTHNAWTLYEYYSDAYRVKRELKLRNSSDGRLQGR